MADKRSVPCHINKYPGVPSTATSYGIGKHFEGMIEGLIESGRACGS